MMSFMPKDLERLLGGMVGAGSGRLDRGQEAVCGWAAGHPPRTGRASALPIPLTPSASPTFRAPALTSQF